VGPQRGRADALYTAREVGAVTARGNHAGGEHDCVQTRAALAVDSQPGHGDRKSGLQQGESRNISACSYSVADDYVGDGAGPQTGFREQGVQHGRQQFVGTQRAERSSRTAERRAPGSDDNGLTIVRQQAPTPGIGAWAFRQGVGPSGRPRRSSRSKAAG
jgi:hypothetical protein